MKIVNKHIPPLSGTGNVTQSSRDQKEMIGQYACCEQVTSKTEANSESDPVGQGPVQEMKFSS